MCFGGRLMQAEHVLLPRPLQWRFQGHLLPPDQQGLAEHVGGGTENEHSLSPHHLVVTGIIWRHLSMLQATPPGAKKAHILCVAHHGAWLRPATAEAWDHMLSLVVQHSTAHICCPSGRAGPANHAAQADSLRRAQRMITAHHHVKSGIIRHNHRAAVVGAFAYPGSIRVVRTRLNSHWVQAHAWCMIVVFAILFPAGIIWARYFRVSSLGRPVLLCCSRSAVEKMLSQATVWTAVVPCQCWVQEHARCMLVVFAILFPTGIPWESFQ